GGLAQCWHLKRTSPVSFLACGRTGFIINLSEQRLYQAGRRAGAATCSESQISRQFDAFYPKTVILIYEPIHCESVTYDSFRPFGIVAARSVRRTVHKWLKF